MKIICKFALYKKLIHNISKKFICHIIKKDMKKSLTSLFLSLFIVVSPLFAQETTSETETETVTISKEVKRERAEKKIFSNWSVMGKGGISLFDGDVLQEYNQFIPQGATKLGLGASVEGSFTPRWGIGIEYNYLQMGADTDNTEFTGTMHFPSVYLSFNLSNLFYNHRDHVKWSIYADLGLGIGFYKSESTKTPASATPHKIDNGQAAAFVAGINLEYNFTKYLALSWSNQYRMFNKDNLEAANHIKGNTNDAIFSSMLGLRYKFGTSKHEHIRNIDYDTYNGDYAEKMDSIMTRVKELDKKVNTLEQTTPTKGDVDNLKNKLDNLDDYIKQQFEGPDSDGDGVPDVRDREPNTPPGSYVNYWGEALPFDMTTNIPSIFFDFDRSNLDQKSKSIIQEVALKMSQNPNLKVEIRGYADNEGTVDYNIKLSTKRALITKQELVEVYKIEESRIIANGLGKILQPASRYPLNRRCDFLFDK